MSERRVSGGGATGALLYFSERCSSGHLPLLLASLCFQLICPLHTLLHTASSGPLLSTGAVHLNLSCLEITPSPSLVHSGRQWAGTLNRVIKCSCLICSPAVHLISSPFRLAAAAADRADDDHA